MSQFIVNNPLLAGYNLVTQFALQTAIKALSPTFVNEVITSIAHGMQDCLTLYDQIPVMPEPITYTENGNGTSSDVTYSSPTNMVMKVSVLKRGEAKDKGEQGVMIVNSKTLHVYIIRPQQLTSIHISDWMISQSPLTHKGHVSELAHSSQELFMQKASQTMKVFLNIIKNALSYRLGKKDQILTHQTARTIIETVLTKDTTGIVIQFLMDEKLDPREILSLT